MTSASPSDGRLPNHGTRARLRICGCTKCCALREGATAKEIRELPERHWPYRSLEMARLGPIARHFDSDTVTRWRVDGLSDVESDQVAIYFGVHPSTIWRGWFDAGLDYE